MFEMQRPKHDKLRRYCFKIRTNASPKLERTRWPEEKHVILCGRGTTVPSVYGNLAEIGQVWKQGQNCVVM